jgi:hypothetical protein
MFLPANIAAADATRMVSLTEVVGAFSHALDLTEGQPEGHCLRAAWIGCAIGKAIGLDDQQVHDLRHCILLKDLGCSSNAARICELYLTDDRASNMIISSSATALPMPCASSSPGPAGARRSVHAPGRSAIS